MLPARLAGAFPHAPGRGTAPPYRRENRPCHFVRLARLPIISLAHRRLSFVSGTKTKCRWGVFSSMCTIAETMFSRPTRSMRKSAAPLEVGRYLLWDLPLKNSGLAVISVSTNRVLSLAGAASGLLDAALNEMVVAAIRLDDVEIVLAPAGVNVRVAGVLLLFSVHGGLPAAPPGGPCASQIAKLRVVPLNSFPHSIPFPAGFPAENISDRIGME